MNRRTFVKAAAGAAVAGGVLARCRPAPPADEAPRWTPASYRKPERSEIAVLRADAYDESRLVDVVRRGIGLFDLPVRGRRIVLKPNLVEFDPNGVINTHPALIGATIEAFRSLGATDVVVAEGPGHRRDNEYLLAASGLLDVLRDTGSRYVDLNTDHVRAVRTPTRFSRLGTIWLPATVLDADLFVSMPKLKTHHWAGVTLSMKNLFGIMPGAVYGWPKNPLHWNGIPESILDINAALDVPRFNIVDGVVGMEGDGPIRGDARTSGVLVFGADPVAADATCARLMRLDPTRVSYLAQADQFLGNVRYEAVRDLGEDPLPFAQDYRVIGSFRHLKASAEAG